MKKIIATLLTVILLSNTLLYFNVFSETNIKILSLNEDCEVTVDVNKRDTFDFIFTAKKRGLYNLCTDNDYLQMYIEDVECDNDDFYYYDFDFFEDFVLNAGQSIKLTISFSNSDTYTFKVVNSNNLYNYDTAYGGDEIHLKGYFGNEETVIIPDYIDDLPVTMINYSCFYDCPTIQTVVFSNTLEMIDEQAFINCPNLHTLHFSSSVAVAGGITEDSIIGKNCPNVSTITVDKNNPYLDSRENCNAIIESKQNILRLGCKDTIIPKNVEHIGDGAFRNCSVLKTINIPSSVQTIGMYSFLSCTSLTDVYLTKNISFISYNAFDECDSLRNVYFNGTPKDWKKIEIMRGNDALLNAKMHFINDIGKEYSSAVVKPTSTNVGYTLFTAVDGSSFKDNFTAPTGKQTLKCKARSATAEKVQWNNVKTATGYQVQISTKDGKKWASTVNCKAGITSYTFKNLAAGNHYKFRVRFYINAADGKNYYSPWSATLNSPTLPTGTTLTKLSPAKKAFSAQWKKAGFTGYQIQYSLKSNFSSAKTVTVKNAKTVKASIKNLNTKKVYYVRIRTYKTISKANYFSSWSKAYKVKTK